MTPAFETPRLLLLPTTLDDAGQIQRIFPQWEIVKYLANIVPWPYPPDGAVTFFRDQMLPSVQRGETWAWTIRLKTAPDEIIGSITLHTREDNNRGFWIVPEHQRQGLMTEACEAVTGFWFNTLKMPVLRVPKAIPNTGSRRISEKQGMRSSALKSASLSPGATLPRYGRSLLRSGMPGISIPPEHFPDIIRT